MPPPTPPRLRLARFLAVVLGDLGLKGAQKSILCFVHISIPFWLHFGLDLGTFWGPSWHRNRSKRRQKSSLKATYPGKSTFFSVPVLFLADCCSRYGPPLHASGTLWPSKRRGFLESDALDSQKVVSHHIWGHWHFRVVAFSRIGGSSPSRKRQFSMIVAQSHAIQKKALHISR